MINLKLLVLEESHGVERVVSFVVVVIDAVYSRQRRGTFKLACQSPFSLSPGTFTSFTWQDNSTAPTLTVSETGEYRVTVSDGVCTDSATIRVEFLEDLYPGTKLFVPEDTTLCAEFFPLQISASSPYSDSLFVLETKSERLVIENPGNYTVGVDLDGCLFTERVRVESDPCIPDLYLPNAFSPNGDGINDTWQAFGDEFEVVNYRVYDRWGGVLYNGAEPWDGRSGGDYVQQGVYLLEVEYRNLLTGSATVERVVQDVVAVR